MASATAPNVARLCALACRRTPRFHQFQRTQFIAQSNSSTARRAFTTSTIRAQDEQQPPKDDLPADNEQPAKGDEPAKVEQPSSSETQEASAPAPDVSAAASSPALDGGKERGELTEDALRLEAEKAVDQTVKEAGYLTMQDYVEGKIRSREGASALQRAMEQSLQSIDNGPRAFKNAYWFDEDDPESFTEDMDEFDEDDMTSMAHGKLEEIREMRQYQRQIVWELPLLSKYAKPFKLPTDKQVLRWRYTSYMGESHPAESKVVVQFAPDDLGLTPVQTSKLKKLAGVRYDPRKEFVKISCESYPNAAQNKSYLSNLVDDLIAAAKDDKDTFEDITLDTRHHRVKPKPRFPKEWFLTEERKAELKARREKASQSELEMETQGTLVDGKQAIDKFLLEKMEQEQFKAQAKLEAAKEAVPVRAGAKRPVSRGGRW